MPAGLHLQPRDVLILALMGDLGLLDTDTIHQRFFATVSRRRCQQRLQLFRAHGLIRSVVLTVWFSDTENGRTPAIHVLTERGAEAVLSLVGSYPRRVLRSDPKPETFHHRLAIVKSRLALDDACAIAGLHEPAWIMEQDRNPAATDVPPLQRRMLYHAFRNGPKTITCQPDAACLLAIPRDIDKPQADTTNLLVYWEIDRSSESQSQLLRKLPGYAAAIEQRAYHRYWPGVQKPAVRVFWVCRSRQRISEICDRLKDVPVARLFRFTTSQELSVENRSHPTHLAQRGG